MFVFSGTFINPPVLLLQFSFQNHLVVLGSDKGHIGDLMTDSSFKFENIFQCISLDWAASCNLIKLAEIIYAQK